MSTADQQYRSPLLTTVAPRMGGGDCRVCGQPIPYGAPSRSRAWGIEGSHEECGWFRPFEGAPRKVRKPGTVFDHWEWQCPECGLDACSPKMSPPPPGPMRDRCGRCKRVSVGDRAYLDRNLLVRGVPLRRGMIVVVDSFRAGSDGSRDAVVHFELNVDAKMTVASRHLARMP